jgi:hypothetical protein
MDSRSSTSKSSRARKAVCQFDDLIAHARRCGALSRYRAKAAPAETEIEAVNLRQKLRQALLVFVLEG